MSTVVKFTKLTKNPTFTNIETFAITVENDVFQYANGAEYNRLKGLLPAMISDDVPELSKDAFTDPATYDHYSSILKEASRATFAKDLDIVFRRIGIVWPDTLKVSSLTPVEKIEFFRFLTEELDKLS
jgi:hypothetical protein